MTMLKQYNVKGVARNDKPTENYHLNRQLFKALQSFIVSFSSLFSCSAASLLLLPA